MAASTTPITSQKVSLMHYSSGAYGQLVCIKDFPDLDTELEKDQVEITTLCDDYHKYIDGLGNLGDALEFTANYIKNDYDTIKALSGTQQFALYFNTGSSFDGDNGKFYLDGEVSVVVNGAGVGDVVEMTIRIKLNSPITTTEPAH